MGIFSTFNMFDINEVTAQFTLTVPDGTIAGNMDFLTGEVTGIFTPTGGAAVPISGARR